MAETHSDVGEVLQLVGVRRFVYTIDKRLSSTLLRHDTNSLCHLPICQKHKLFHKFVGVFRFFEEHIDRTSGAVDIKTHLHAIEFQRAIGETLGTKFLSQAVERKYLFAIIALACFNYVLSLLIGEATVTLDHCVANIHFLHLRIVVHFHNHRVSEFFLIGA